MLTTKSLKLFLTIANYDAELLSVTEYESITDEIGHIANGDVNKKGCYLDTGIDSSREKKADDFAYKALSSAD